MTTDTPQITINNIWVTRKKKRVKKMVSFWTANSRGAIASLTSKKQSANSVAFYI